ncbi:MAG: heavy metal translocating P-type ATPase [Geobacteraceae bacterium]|nr:heavy metal translocating P-type ATPase [Geobacteraceae bacterium]
MKHLNSFGEHGESAHDACSCSCGHEVRHDTEEAPASPREVVLPDTFRVSRFRIDDMDCPVEERLIRNKLVAMPGILKLEFNLIERELTVCHTLDDTSLIVASIDALGMTPCELNGAMQHEPEKALYTVPVKTWWFMGISGAAALGSEAVAWATGAESSPLIISLALASIICGSLSTLKKGLIALKSLTLNISFLMSVAVIGAAAIGQWPEAAVVIWLFTLAEKIEALSLDRARNAIRRLMAVAPETATVRGENGEWKEVEARSVRTGQVVRVRAGERIPLDGVVVTGWSSVNQASITGESIPVDKVAGDAVFAGTVNGNGSFEFRVGGDYEHTTLSHIVAAVQKAQSERAPTQRFVDSFARYYTPSVVAAAVLVAIVPPVLLGAEWHAWIYNALVMLVISCPCALVISTPVTVVSGLAAAAHHGMLIKGGAYLERGRKLKFLAFDKTGTLTVGKPSVTEIIPMGNLPEGDELYLAASLDAHASHPIARCIVAHWNDRGDERGLLPVTDFRNLPGHGVSGEINGQCYYLGNQRLAEELGVLTPLLERELYRLEQSGGTAVVLAGPSGPLALIAVADKLREHARQAIGELRDLGVKAVMLSGDNHLTARAIGQGAGIEDARGNLLPEEKLDAIAGLQQTGPVGMVGDGINDAPALARADIGFAMGAAGADSALETADVALMDDDLRKLPDFIRLSRRTGLLLSQNIIFALSTKVLFFGLTLVGQVTLWMAVFADMGVSLLVVFNSLRLLGFFNGRAR